MNPGKTEQQIFETLGILQEECAEVVVEVSKCRRFGLNSVHYKTNIEHSLMLEQELGDVLAMIDILVEQGVVDAVRLDAATLAKKQKLQQWSKIYENTTN